MLNNSLKINIVYTLIILKLNIKHYLYTYIMNFYVFIGISNTKKNSQKYLRVYIYFYLY